jgi:hypothetical protein
MRTIAILPIAAASLAAGAIGAWSLGFASQRTVVANLATSTAVCVAPSAVVEPHAKPRPTLVAALRYRAETCSGDYVCGEDGAWEVAAQSGER